MKKHGAQKIIALFMVLCILCGMLPAPSVAAAEARSTTVSSEAELRTAVESDGEIILTGKSLDLEAPIHIPADKTITITGSKDSRITIQPKIGWTGGTSGLFIIESGATVTFKNLVINGSGTTRCINITGGAKAVTLDYVAIQNGNAGGENGGGICADGGSNGGTLTITNGCVFTGNQTTTKEPSGGGAIYVGSGWVARISPGEGHNRVDFTGNKSHSGACIYAYRSYVLAEKCHFGGQTGHSDQNKAGQRGGAIHSHGTVVLKDCIVMHNSSDQYGGGIYVSANEDDYYGSVVLDNTRVEANNAVNNGGGVFLASLGSLYLRNGSTITNNSLVSASDEIKAPEWSAKNNLYYSNALGRIVLCDASIDEVGISTANPYNQKLAVYSLSDPKMTQGLRDALNGFPADFGYSMDDYSYEMADGAYAGRITSDSKVWLLQDGASDPDGKKTLGNGKMWFNIDPGYGAEGNTIIFDLNLPNKEAIVHSGLEAGTPIGLPTVEDDIQQGVTFKFRGWYDQPSSGDPAPQTIMVEENMGIKVYYAHWNIIPPEHDIDPIPGVEQMYLAYFYLNYDGGGFTSSYIVAGDFTFTVHYTIPGPDGPIPQSKKIPVKIPWSWPGKPHRTGYTFTGWALSENGAPVDTATWTPDKLVTTFYAQWTPDDCTLTWNPNYDGASGSTTSQKYDTTVSPDTPPTRTGYTFTGWYLDSSCSVPLTSGTLVEGDATFYAGWAPKEYTITWDAGYAEGVITTVKQHHDEALNILPTPTREGYTFNGWYTGNAKAEGYGKVREDVTFTARWTAKTYTLNWNANSGVGSCTTTQAHDETVKPPTTPPTKYGYAFTGWYLDDKCTIPLASGTLVTGPATFYAGWTPLEYTMTWDANYMGGTITSIKQYHDEKLYDMPAPTRDGYGFVGWNTKRDGSGVSGDPDVYGTVYQDETFYAQWDRHVQSYTVTVEWDDLSNNDNVRPESISVQLMANGIPATVNNQPVTYTFNAADHTGDVWTHTFHRLPVTDTVSNPITYSVAITSTVSDEYTYGIENKSANLGYILLTHSLITTDINSYVVWEDDSNNDGYRPSTVNLQLFANGKKVEDAEARLSISGSGDTWTYSFKDFQKYYTDDAGNKGQEIRYTLEATPTNDNELDEYTIAYHNYTVVLSHKKDTVKREVVVVWQDSNNQDGKRPVNMTVQLYADNVPLEGKTVTLSDVNKWTHAWEGLDKYTDGGREVVYSARVTSTLVDYTAKSTGMTIEMTYVPSSTSISAFVTWVDENDADGLRPDYIIAELLANGKPTGNTQMLSATSGWTVNWTGFPIYKNGDRIEYKFQIQVPDGYKATYHGVYDTTGLSAVLTHERLKQSLTGNIVWEDKNNQSGARLGEVTVLLYADGSVIDEDDRVVINAADNWEHVFENLPIYRDHGQEIKYSMVLVSDPGSYVATTSKMTITMSLEPEFVDVPFQIIWDDNNDSDGKRPQQVKVVLMVNGQPSDKTEFITKEMDWAAAFTHLDYSGPSGVYRYRVALDKVPEGYIAEEATNAVTLKRVAETKDVTATVIWQDNNDQYGQRPQQVTLTLYADYLDGNGPQNTGIVEKCKATEGWQFTFEGVPVLHNGKRIIYSVKASGDLTNYTMLEDGMDVYMKHKGYDPGDVTTEYTAKVVWHDGHNAMGSRPYNLLVTLYADGKSYDSYTMTEADQDATKYTWCHTFTKLPAKVDGKDVVYTIGVTEPTHYTAKTEKNTITLTHVKDIPILVRWGDNGNNDNIRPTSLTLELFADAVKTDVTLPITGSSTADTWRNTFLQVPVWSEAEMDREIVYTWKFASGDPAGYHVDYNGHKEATVENEKVYPIDLTHGDNLQPVEVVVTWNDEEDADGKRPDSLDLRLLADGVDTGKTMTISGSDTASEWRDTFVDLPVMKNGQKIKYSLQKPDLDGYRAESDEGDAENPLALGLTHDRIMDDIAATVKWMDTSKPGGLTRFPITVELVVDGVPSGEIQTITDPDTAASFGTLELYHDHGVAYEYSVQVTEDTDIPADDDVTVDGLTVTVEKVRYYISGQISAFGIEDGVPTSTALLHMYRPNGSSVILEQVFADEEGRYNFLVDSGRYAVQGILDGYVGVEKYVDVDIEANKVDVVQDIELPATVMLYPITVHVIGPDGAPVSGAKVEFTRGTQGVVLSMETENGDCSLALPNGGYLLQARYELGEDDFKGQVTVSESIPWNPRWDGKEVTLRVTIPKDGATSMVGSAVYKSTNKPAAGLTVRCYGTKAYPIMAAEVTTNDDGDFVFRGLADDEYRLVFLDHGKEIVLSPRVTFTIPGDTSVRVTIPDNASQDPTPFGAGSLSGIALDKAGHPIEDAQVIVTDKSTGKVAGILTTGSDGVFETELPAGEYTVELWKPFESDTDHTLCVGDEAASQEDGPVTADSFTVSGYVLDEDGQPMEGITVYLYGEDGQLVQSIFVDDDAQESAPAEDEIPAIAKAMASEMVEAVEEVVFTKVEEVLAEIVPAEDDEMAKEPASEAEDASEEAPTEPEEADAELVADEPTEDNTADLFADDGFIRLDERVTAEDGKYVFAGLPAGRYVVKIAQGIGGNGGSTDIPITVQPLPEIPDDANLTVTTDSYTVSDTVVDKEGKPVNGAKVTLLDDQGEEISHMTTNADGAYQFEALPKGDYTVNISYPDSELLASGDVTITDGGFTAFPGQVVDGTLKDNKGNTLANVTVTVHGEDGKTYTATTDKDGNYRVVVPDGKYTVEVNINGKTASKAITVSGKPVTADLTVTLSSGSGSGSGGSGGGSGSGGSGGGSGSGGSGGIGGGSGSGSVTEQPKVVLSGVVLDKDGNGVVGATVTAVDTKTGETYTATTGLDGKYALAVPKGNYTITITYGSTTTNPKKVTVSKDAKLDDMAMDNLGKLVYGYVKGYGDGTFGGERSITRSEVAALISRISPDFDASQTYAFDFKDVSENAWYAKNLGYCVKAGLIQGRGNGHFDPNANITRAEFAAIVARFLGLPNEVMGTKVSYTDTENNWAEGYIAQLTAKGIVEGKGDGKFDPAANISRYEAVTMLNRALDRTPDKAALDGLMANLVIRAFPDLKADHWAYYQVLEAAFDHYHK